MLGSLPIHSGGKRGQEAATAQPRARGANAPGWFPRPQHTQGCPKPSRGALWEQGAVESPRVPPAPPQVFQLPPPLRAFALLQPTRASHQGAGGLWGKAAGLVVPRRVIFFPQVVRNINVGLFVRVPGRQSSWRGVQQDGAAPSGSSETPACPAGTALRGWTETRKDDTEPKEQSDTGRAVCHPRCTRCFLHQEQGSIRQHRQRSPPTSSHVLTGGFPHQRALLSNSLTSVRGERNKTLF